VLFGLSAPLIAPGRPTVASLLKAKGYHTACFGKWHLGLGWAGQTTDDPLLKGGAVDYAKPLSDSPLSHGFDTFFGITGSLDMAPYTYIENDRLTALPTRTSSEGGRAGPTAPGFSALDVLPAITAKAEAYIAARAQVAKAGTPFFLYLPLNAPHTPVVPSGPWRRDHPLGLHDLFATAAELVGADYPESAAEDSVSFLPLLRGEAGRRTDLIMHSVNGRFAFREGAWKLVAWRGSGGFSDNQKRPDGTRVHDGLPDAQLYDLAADPAETRNLAAEQPERVRRLREALEKAVAAGRTTPGAPQTNDVPVVIDKTVP